MSKRGFQNFDRRPQDAYDTPAKAVEPLLALLEPDTFVEPCAGAGALVRALEAAGHRCVYASDIAPRGPGIAAHDGAELPAELRRQAAWVITNPPYLREEVVRLMGAWIDLGFDSILLVPHDWLCNQWFAPFSSRVRDIVTVGRVKWIEGSKHTSAENFIWLRIGPTPRALGEGALIWPRMETTEETIDA